MEAVFEGNYDFSGLWNMPSRCGLKIIKTVLNTVIIVSELYKENPGTTITDAPAQLAGQICKHFSIDYESMIYIEHNPKTNTKLSFYEEEYFRVFFAVNDGLLENPEYKKISVDELSGLLNPLCS